MTEEIRNILLGAFVLALAITAAWPVRAHDPYSDWRKPDNPGVSCCNNSDCRPTRAYVDDDGNWRAWNGQKWLVVPWAVVLPADYAKDGRSHLCEKGEYIYCFTPGPPRS